MDFSLRSTLCNISLLRKGRFEEIALVGISISPTHREQQNSQ